MQDNISMGRRSLLSSLAALPLLGFLGRRAQGAKRLSTTVGAVADDRTPYAVSAEGLSCTQLVRGRQAAVDLVTRALGLDDPRLAEPWNRKVIADFLAGRREQLLVFRTRPAGLSAWTNLLTED